MTKAIAAGAELGRPLQVHTLGGDPSYWFVPVANGDRLVGFLRLSPGADVLAHGSFGQATEMAEYPPLEIVDHAHATAAIRAEFGNEYDEIGPTILVHDGPPDRICWVAEAVSDRGTTYLFWSFGTAYRRHGDVRSSSDSSG